MMVARKPLKRTRGHANLNPFGGQVAPRQEPQQQVVVPGSLTGAWIILFLVLYFLIQFPVYFYRSYSVFTNEDVQSDVAPSRHAQDAPSRPSPFLLAAEQILEEVCECLLMMVILGTLVMLCIYLARAIFYELGRAAYALFRICCCIVTAIRESMVMVEVVEEEEKITWEEVRQRHNRQRASSVDSMICLHGGFNGTQLSCKPRGRRFERPQNYREEEHTW
ncbi:hypothetical protein EIP91_007689 [Steccherinum ochraceum]|uniref:Uncharacterized protein n=1 Tax=Steccherinum ochraceum TaxID=92696 RepID=A0A4R0RC59_9APHY|nr:hypothetical protein EIP91_007689 [Steccherinum ochraceum]